MLQFKPAVSKRILFVFCLFPIYSIAYAIYQDALGANPVEYLERHFGKCTLIFLCLTLSITPIRNLTKNPMWIIYRRMLGLFVFFYATVHLMVYLVIDYQFVWADIAKDILKHRYVLVGFLAWTLLLPLALTSTNKMIQRLKRRWKTLHRLVYVIAILGVLHFFWLVKKDMTEPIIYSMVIGILLLMRLKANSGIPKFYRNWIKEK
jgi:sulfoxide reductase heme-binding subunit YedZ